MGIKNDGELHSKTELEIIKRENDDLKKALGESTLEIKVLKKNRTAEAVGDGSTTKQEVESLSVSFGLSMNRIIKILGVAKSSLYYKSKTYPSRKAITKKQISEQAKESIKAITSKKATVRRTAYGTPRVRAILKRDYNIILSKYMVHRYMKEEGLLLKRFRPRGSSRPHTGKISVDKPNTRWASDITGPRRHPSNVGMVKNSD